MNSLLRIYGIPPTLNMLNAINDCNPFHALQNDVALLIRCSGLKMKGSCDLING